MSNETKARTETVQARKAEPLRTTQDWERALQEQPLPEIEPVLRHVTTARAWIDAAQGVAFDSAISPDDADISALRYFDCHVREQVELARQALLAFFADTELVDSSAEAYGEVQVLASIFGDMLQEGVEWEKRWVATWADAKSVEQVVRAFRKHADRMGEYTRDLNMSFERLVLAYFKVVQV